MNFKSVTKLIIPEGEVVAIHRGSMLLWSKPTEVKASDNSSSTLSFTEKDVEKGVTYGSSPSTSNSIE